VTWNRGFKTWNRNSVTRNHDYVIRNHDSEGQNRNSEAENRGSETQNQEYYIGLQLDVVLSKALLSVPPANEGMRDEVKTRDFLSFIHPSSLRPHPSS
jgi:hypothetical protein